MTNRPDNNARRDLFTPRDRSRPPVGSPGERPAPVRVNGTVYPRRRRGWRLARSAAGCLLLLLVGAVAGVAMGMFLLVVTR